MVKQMKKTVNPNVHLRDSESYANYRDQHDDYEYLVSVKKEFYLASEYELEKGVLDLMYADNILNETVYRQLYQDVCNKEYETNCRSHRFMFYLLMCISICIHVFYRSNSDPKKEYIPKNQSEDWFETTYNDM